MTLRLGMAALALLVAACQGTPAHQQWTKKDATPEDIKRDLYWCTRKVEHRTVLQTPAQERRITEIVDDECMEKRGYSKKG